MAADNVVTEINTEIDCRTAGRLGTRVWSNQAPVIAELESGGPLARRARAEGSRHV